MTREQQVDIVAQAIRRAFEQRTNRPRFSKWDKVGEELREAFRFEARAAIEAYERSCKSPRELDASALKQTVIM
jgi:hypothetical protein